jgi:hypothetical protein
MPGIFDAFANGYGMSPAGEWNMSGLPLVVVKIKRETPEAVCA